MSRYVTRNTDCRDAERNEDGFWALARLMERELYKADDKRLRTPGVCAVCGVGMKVAYNVWRDEDGKLFEFDRGSEFSRKVEAGLVDSNKFTVYPNYHCDVLLDRWFFCESRGKKISPLDGAEMLRAEHRAQAKAVANGEDRKPIAPVSGVDKLEALDV